jgi:hypothetical protein
LSKHLFSLDMSSCILMSQNSAACECNQTVTTYFTFSSFWNFWLDRHFFKCNNKWKLLGRSGLCTGWSKTSQLKCCNSCCVALTVCARVVVQLSRRCVSTALNLCSELDVQAFSVFHNMLQCLWWSLRCKITQETPPFNPSRQLPWVYCCWCFEFIFHWRMSTVPHHQL